jgi:sugar/nucleoside kinase (ribokinase family)
VARENGILISADSQTSSQIGNLSQFSGVDLITPTEVEARMELKDQSSGLAIIVEKLRLHMNVASILLKLGSDGVLVHGTDAQGRMMATDAIPSLNPNPVDTSGAGDSMLAAASLALAIERNLSKAGLLGSVTAAVQISRTGNIPIEQANLAYMISS